MAVVNVQNVTKQFGGQIVLAGVSLEIAPRECVGLIGTNGAGKTTLFRIMAGEIPPDTGTVTLSRGMDIGYLPQEHASASDRTLHEEVGRAFDELLAMEAKLHALADQIAAAHDTPGVTELMNAYDRLHARFEIAGGHTFEVRLNEILGGLGFTEVDHQKPMSQLSGGQRCRASLARLLLEDKTFLLLDEPTNHLDIDATRWLEKYLARHEGPVVVISHDRYLLDRLCNRIVEVERGRANSFAGNYTRYAETKGLMRLTQEREFEKDRAFIEKERAFITKHISGQRTKEAQGRRTRLERRLAAGEFVTEQTTTHQSAAIGFSEANNSASTALRCDDVAIGYGDVTLAKDLNFQLAPAERFAITGPNGTGKTTFLRSLLGEVDLLAGEFQFAPRLSIGYYAQNEEPEDPKRLVLEELRQAYPELTEQKARNILASFLFRGDDVFKPIGALSGGEQSRVRLAKLILSNPDVLILDEPTNHLDIPSRERLEEALQSFNGTIITVSHDRYFLDQIAQRLLMLRPDKHGIYRGGYTDYLRTVEQAERSNATSKTKSKKPKQKKPKTQRKKSSPYDTFSVEQLEEKVLEKEMKLAELQEKFGDPKICKDADRLAELKEDVEDMTRELAEVDQAWQQRAAQ